MSRKLQSQRLTFKLILKYPSVFVIIMQTDFFIMRYVMIKNVLFDLDDTILDFKKSERIAIAKTFTKFGIEASEENIAKYSKYNISQWKRLELGEISLDEVKVNRFRLLLMI